MIEADSHRLTGSFNQFQAENVRDSYFCGFKRQVIYLKSRRIPQCFITEIFPVSNQTNIEVDDEQS